MNKEVIIKETEVTLSVTNPAELAEASERYVFLKNELKKVEDHEKKILKPLNDAVKAARDEWRPLKDSLKGAIDRVKKAMSDYQTKAEAEAEDAKDKIANRMVSGTLKPETAANKIAAIETPEKRVGDVSFMIDYEIEVVDIEKVPFEYLKVELRRAEIKKAAKEGKVIDGLVIKEVKVPKKV